jgi:hypothetical protein
MLRPLCAIALIPGCLTADGVDGPESIDSSEVALAETVIKAPTPHASCIAGCVSGNGFGSPVTIMTSYYGLCSQWGDVYECQAQPYSLAFECIGAPCTVAPTNWSWQATTSVTPAPGVTGIRVRVFKSVGSDYNPIEVLNTIITPTAPPPPSPAAADRIESYCNDGNGQPCVARPNKPPVYLHFTLMAGTQVVPVPSLGFDLMTTAYGTAGNLNESWRTGTPGVQTVTVRYGSLSLTKTFEVYGFDLGTETEIEPVRN